MRTLTPETLATIDARAWEIDLSNYMAESLHAVRDTQKRDAILKSLLSDGWQGLPLLAYNDGNGRHLINGTHRDSALNIARDMQRSGEEIDIEGRLYEVDFADLEAAEDWIGDAGDDEERISILETVDPIAAAILKSERAENDN